MLWHDNLANLNQSNNSWQWLSYKGSLTKFLQGKANYEELIIKQISQFWRMPNEDESVRLHLKENHKILERKIVMLVMNRPWLFARTYFTKDASDYLGHDLNMLGNKPLGDLILNNYTRLSRSKFQFSYLSPKSKLYLEIKSYFESINFDINHNNILENKLIIRRSLFSSNILNDNKPLFNIDEVFLPALVNKMLNLEVDVLQE